MLLPCSSQLTIYKSFVRTHLDYVDVICDQSNHSRLSDEIETVQYNAVYNAKEKLYQELGLKSLKDRRWLRQMPYLYQIISTKLPPYLYEEIPPRKRSQRYSGCFHTLRCRTTLFQNSFLPFIITEWNKLDSDEKLLTFIRPLGIHDPLAQPL